MSVEEQAVPKRSAKKPKTAHRVQIDKGLWSYESIERDSERETETVLKIIQEAEKGSPELPVRIPL